MIGFLSFSSAYHLYLLSIIDTEHFAICFIFFHIFIKKKDMRQNERPIIFRKPQQISKKASQESELAGMRAELNELKMRVQEKKDQMFGLNSRLREEGLKNQKLKKEVVEADERFKMFAQKQIQYFAEKYKDNKDSPLFYNESGLSPFELLRIGDQKYQEYQPGNICMVCYSELEKMTKILVLPCSHLVHKECGIQYFLSCPNCPACGLNLKNMI